MAGGVHHIASPTITASTVATPSASSAVVLDSKFSDVSERFIGIGAPATLTNTVHIQVDRTSTGDWVDVFQEGTGANNDKVEIPAGGWRRLSHLAAPRLRLQSTGGEASDRTFEVWLR